MMFPARYLVAVVILLSTSMSHAFDIRSESFSPDKPVDNDQIYNETGCSGKNLSPDIQWSDLPKGTKSIAVTLFDPDAPGSGWWHWFVIDIPAEVKGLPEGAGDINDTELPSPAIMLTNDYGVAGYSGPCPPKGSGEHTYQLTVYAMKDKLPGISENAAPATAAFLIRNEAIASKTIEVKLKR